MGKVVFTKNKPDFEKHKKKLEFDGLLEKKRQKDKQRLRWNLVLVLVEVALVLVLAYWAVAKLATLKTDLCPRPNIVVSCLLSFIG
jgi:hypothetical protein